MKRVRAYRTAERSSGLLMAAALMMRIFLEAGAVLVLPPQFAELPSGVKVNCSVVMVVYGLLFSWV